MKPASRYQENHVIGYSCDEPLRPARAVLVIMIPTVTYETDHYHEMSKEWSMDAVQQTVACTESTVETPEEGVEYVRS